MIRLFSVDLFMVAFVSLTLNLRAFAKDDFQALYRARGVANYTVRTNGFHMFEQQFTFSFLEGSHGEWRLELTGTTPDLDQILSTEIISYDGTNIYSITYSDKRVETSPDGRIKVVNGNSSHPARICTGPYPVDHGPTAGLIWLAFVGGRYIEPQTTSQRLPNLLVLPDARHDPMAWACVLQDIRLSNGSRPLIVSGKIRLDTNYLFATSLKYDLLDEPETEKGLEAFNSQIALYRKTSPDRLVRASYHLNKSFHVEGLDIPKAFSAEVSSPLLIPDLYSTNTTIAVECAVTDVVKQPSADLPPPLEGQVTVQDRRLRFKGPSTWRREVYYPLVKGHWITDTNDQVIRAALKAQHERQRFVSSHRISKFRLVSFIFVLAVIAPGIFLFYKTIKARKTLSAVE